MTPRDDNLMRKVLRPGDYERFKKVERNLQDFLGWRTMLLTREGKTMLVLIVEEEGRLTSNTIGAIDDPTTIEKTLEMMRRYASGRKANQVFEDIAQKFREIGWEVYDDDFCFLVMKKSWQSVDGKLRIVRNGLAWPFSLGGALEMIDFLSSKDPGSDFFAIDWQRYPLSKIWDIATYAL